jgi:hypothetical protein
MNGKLVPELAWRRSVLLALTMSLGGGQFCGSSAKAADALESGSSTNSPASAPGATDLLQFIDGSTLHGRLRSMSSGQGVSWEYPDAKGLIQFRPTNIAWIRFEKPKAVATASAPACRFRFNNGDEVFGNLTSFEQNSLTLETWFGGALQTERAALHSITFLSKGYSILFEGPTSDEGWVHGKQTRSWEYRDGAFVATGAGTLGRDFKLSGSSSFSFDLAWNGHFSLILALYTPVLDRFDYSSSSYMFYLSPGYITLQRIQGGAGAMNLGQAQITEMGKKNKLHMEIRASKEDSTLVLLVDDRLVQRWKDSSGFVGQGSGAVFFAQLDGPSIRVSNLKVAQWEGDLALEAQGNNPSKEDLVYLVNKDKVNGRLQSLRNGALSVAAGQTVLDIPLARVNQINFGSSTTNRPLSTPWELRAYFAGGGTVAFDLAAWKEGHVSGKSANFGQVDFDPQLIRQFQFNLNRPKPGTGEMEILDDDVWDLE